MKKLFCLALLLVCYRIGLSSNPSSERDHQILEIAKDLMLRGYFFEAGKSLKKAVIDFSAARNSKMEIEARLLLDEAYDETLQQTLREKNLEELLRMAINSDPPSDELINLTRIRWADHLIETKRSREAERYLTAYLPNVLTSKDYLNLSRFYFHLGGSYHMQLKYLEAELSFAKAIDIYHTNVPENYQYYIKLLGAIAIFNLNIGHLDRHDKLLNERIQVLESRPELTSSDSLEIANSHFYLLRSEWRGGDFNKLLEHAEQIYQMYSQISIVHREHLGRCTGWMTTAYKRLNAPELVIELADETYNYLRNPTNKEMAIYSFYAQYNYARRREWSPNERRVKMAKAFEIAEKWKLPLSDAYTYNSQIELSYNNPEASLRNAELAIESSLEENEWVPPSRTKIAYAHMAMGDVLIYLEKYELAIYHFHKALLAYTTDFKTEDVVENPDDTNEFSNMNVLGMVQTKGTCFEKLAKREPRKKIAYLKLAHNAFLSASKVSDKLRTVYFDDASRIKLSQRTYENFSKIVATGYELFELTGDTIYLNAAFLASEKAKAPLLQESFASASAIASEKVPLKVLQTKQILERELAYYKGALLQESNLARKSEDERVNWLKKNIFQLKQELEDWENNFNQNFPDYYLKKQPQIQIHPDEAKQFLRQGEALVEFFFDKEVVYIFYISARSLSMKQIHLPTDFESQVSRLKKSINDLDSVQDSVLSYYQSYTSTAFHLYQSLLAPLLSTESGINKLLIIPDGILYEIPFEALLTDTIQGPGVDYTILPYLIKQYQIRYAPSTSSLLTIMRRKGGPKETRCLAIAPSGNDQVVDQNRGDLETLRSEGVGLIGAQKEVQAISKLGIPGEYYFGNYATEKRFKALAPKFNLLHLALHGHANPEEPLMSNLQFNTGIDSVEDNVLYAHELSEISLDANLVVLSACETGVGRYETGEGNLSLGWFFIANGADAVVTTLWEVEDKSSADLIEEYYRNLVRFLPNAEALHLAKLSMLEKADSRSAHPYYWAGYVANGVSEPLRFSPTSSDSDNRSLWLVTLAGLIVLSFFAFRFRRSILPAKFR